MQLHGEKKMKWMLIIILALSLSGCAKHNKDDKKHNDKNQNVPIHHP